MLPVLNVGPLAIQTGGLIILLGLWVGLLSSEKAAPKFGVDPDHLYRLALTGLIAGLLGARLIYVARYPDAFAGNLLSILSPTPTMFDLSGGLLIGSIAAVVYGQKRQLPLQNTLDSLTPALAVMALAIGLMQLATGRGFGSPTNLPWGIEMWGAVRHPTQLYSIVLSAAIFAIVWRKIRSYPPLTPGMVFWVFLALTAGAQLFLEAYRGDAHTIGGSVRTAQLVAWAALALSLWMIGRRMPSPVNTPVPTKE